MGKKRRFGVLIAILVMGHAVLAREVWRPLHADGTAQPLLGPLIGLDDLLIGPARALLFGLFNDRFFPWLSAAVLGAAFYGLLAAWVGWRLGPKPKADPSLSSRRAFLVRTLRVGLGGGATAAAYGLVVGPRWFEVTRRDVVLRGLPSSLDGLRVVQLTDIHHGLWLAISYVREIVAAANALEPDLVLLTGDYIYRSSAYLDPVVAALADLRPAVGILGVLGNHDRWDGGRLVGAAFADAGLSLIDNGRRVLTPGRELVADASEGLAICGVGDLWTDRINVPRALGGLPAGMPRLLMSHNPDVAEEADLVRSGLRVDLMLSGHTHGGQIWIPGLGTPVVPSRYKQKYAQGLVAGPVCPVYVSRGVGMTVLPVRIGVAPEVTLLTLRAAGASGS